MSHFSPSIGQGFARRRSHAALLGVLLWLLLIQIPAIQAQSLEAYFEAPATAEVTVPEGHLSLQWAARDGTWGEFEFQLEQTLLTHARVSRIAYEGADGGTFVSGLPSEGAHFRVRARTLGTEEWGPWSEPVVVLVDYPERWQVAVLGGVGLVMFAILFGTIIIGIRRTASPTP